MPFPIDVSRYDYYLRMDANEGVVVSGVFRESGGRVHFRVLHSDASSIANSITKSVSKETLQEMVLQKWGGQVGVDLARSAHRAFEGVPRSQIGGENKYLPNGGGFRQHLLPE